MRLVALGCQLYREDKVWEWDMSDRDFMWRDFIKDTFIVIVRIIWTVHHEDPSTTSSKFKRFKRICKSLWSPPLGKLFFILKCSKNYFW